jgi:hypothetical protein
MDRKEPEVGWGPDPDEPKSETIKGRDFAGASYAATEREQTEDVRGKNTPQQADLEHIVDLADLDDDGK